MTAHAAKRRLLRGCTCCVAPVPIVTGCGPDRRSVLAGALAAFALGATSGTDFTAAVAQPAASAKPHRIDIHHHLAPPAWLAEVKGRPMLQPANVAWTAAKFLRRASGTSSKTGRMGCDSDIAPSIPRSRRTVAAVASRAQTPKGITRAGYSSTNA